MNAHTITLINDLKTNADPGMWQVNAVSIYNSESEALADLFDPTAHMVEGTITPDDADAVITIVQGEYDADDITERCGIVEDRFGILYDIYPLNK